MKTDDDGDAPIRRVHVEEAIHRLSEAGIRSRLQIIAIVTALSGLSRKEIAFNVDLVCQREAL